MEMPQWLEPLAHYFEPKPTPLISAKTLQLLLLRQTHDYVILRTEESRELNTALLPRNLTDSTPSLRVVFLASKQKAVESRQFMSILRATDKYSNHTCTIPLNLCLSCPRCLLFGAVSTKGGSDFNIKHRIEYATAFSLEAYADLLEVQTFNAVQEETQKTGQALNVTHNVKPLGRFPSAIALKSCTWKEFVLVVKTVLSAREYGAESRVKGTVRNELTGLVGGLEELITSLEYTLELGSSLEGTPNGNLTEITAEVLKKYQENASFKQELVILEPTQLEKIINEIREFKLTEEFLENLSKDVKHFTEVASS